jgi:hypothetical protein
MHTKPRHTQLLHTEPEASDSYTPAFRASDEAALQRRRWLRNAFELAVWRRAQQRRRWARDALQGAARIRAQRLRRQGARSSVGRSRPRAFAPQAETPAGRPGASAPEAAGPGTKARAFIFQTAGITDDGRGLSAVFRDALRCIHPDSAENRAATPDGPTIELLQRARQDLKDAGLWS